MVNAATTGRAGVVTGDGTSGLLLFGYQFEAGSTPSSYIPTAGAEVTRAADALTIPAANLPWPEPVVIGPELVTNGTFDTDLTGWTLTNVSSTATFTASGGEATFSRDTFGDKVSQEVVAIAGAVYEITFDVTAISGGSGRFAFNTANSTVGLNSLDVFTTGSYSIIGYSGFERMYVVFDMNANGASITIDNISVREINPLAVSIQMEGTMTYADENTAAQGQWFRWNNSGTNNIRILQRSDLGSGSAYFNQTSGGVGDFVQTSGNYYSPGINVPFSIASRHGSTFINGAVDGTALTANLTPTALPYLENTDMQIGSSFSGTIKLFRMWADDLTDEGIAEGSSNV